MKGDHAISPPAHPSWMIHGGAPRRMPVQARPSTRHVPRGCSLAVRLSTDPSHLSQTPGVKYRRTQSGRPLGRGTKLRRTCLWTYSKISLDRPPGTWSCVARRLHCEWDHTLGTT